MIDFQKKKQLSILVNIAMVDEQFADLEKEAIRKISSSYGATDEEMEQVFSSPRINESLAPMSVTDKMDFMMDCMLVILADNLVTTSEEAFAIMVAKKLGFKMEIIQFLIDNKDADRTEIKNRMLAYLVH
jgi:uncharacterized tellurite resistance protein B-like protein